MTGVAFLSELMVELGQRGRNLLWRNRDTKLEPAELCDALMSHKGEVSCSVLSEAIFDHWEQLDEDGQAGFLSMIADRFGPDKEAILAAAKAVQAKPDTDALYRLHRASEPRAQELIRRLNHAQNGTKRLVRMRAALLNALAKHPALKHLDTDFAHLFASWFNRGFLELQPINWNTPASILEKIIQYEAVHAINGWDDLRRRIAPRDRRLFAFFHPQMRDEPLIFVEVALTTEVPDNITHLLASDREEIDPRAATTAVFYSISNCQEGLRGVSFGNLLIKQVVEKLRAELPALRNYVTLSPVPRFAPWLDRLRHDEAQQILTGLERDMLSLLDDANWRDNLDTQRALAPLLQGLACYYFLEERDRRGRPIDPVARFHLDNGAGLEAIHTFADMSKKGRAEAYCLMVNYRYSAAEIEANHEAYAERGEVSASAGVKATLKRFLARSRDGEPSPRKSDQAHVA